MQCLPILAAVQAQMHVLVSSSNSLWERDNSFMEEIKVLGVVIGLACRCGPMASVC